MIDSPERRLNQAVRRLKLAWKHAETDHTPAAQQEVEFWEARLVRLAELDGPPDLACRPESSK